MADRLKHFVAILVLFGLAGAPSVRGAERGSAFAHFADSLLARAPLEGASWSILICSLRSDSILYEKDADRLLTPASVTKLLTSSSALDALGADFRFSTPCYRSGRLAENGVLQGDLIVDAGGDPTAETKADRLLRVPVLFAWADSIAARGVRRIEGDLVLRTWPYRLESASGGWEIGDVNAGFAPAVDGFGFNSNVCHLGVFPGDAPGARVRFVTDPPYAPVRVKSRVTTAGQGADNWLDLQFQPHDTAIVLLGEIPQGDDGEYVWVPMQDPALYFGRALQHALDSRGIALKGRIVVDRAPPSRSDLALLYVHRSVPLPEVLARMNKESDNYASEYVLRALGLAAGGSADRRSGVKSILSFLKRCGIERRAVTLEDGCGLARQNLVSARAVVKVLRAMHSHPLRDVFASTLAVSGEDGTLAYRLGGELAGRVRGKTGTMTHVSALVGYAATDDDEFAFAVLCNNFRTSAAYIRTVQDQIIGYLLRLHQ